MYENTRGDRCGRRGGGIADNGPGGLGGTAGLSPSTGPVRLLAVIRRLTAPPITPTTDAPFVTPSGRTCALGPGRGYNGCSGHPQTAPPGKAGAAISGGQNGPYWIPSNTSYRTTPKGWFSAPLLDIGQSITVDESTCAVRPTA